MLFDDRPKIQRRDLFNRERELQQFLQALKTATPLTLILGMRRLGKTSLMLVGLNESKMPYLVVDARSLPIRYSWRDLYKSLETSLNEFLNRHKKVSTRIREFLGSLRGVEFEVSTKGIRVLLSWGRQERPSLSALLESLNDWAESEGKNLVIALDEAQYLRGPLSLEITRAIAYACDHCRNLLFVLTGSEVGLLHDFIGIEDPEAPLYGRVSMEIRLEKFSKHLSCQFLVAGFKEAGITPSQEFLEEAVTKLNGVVGWLTKLGARCVKYGYADRKLIGLVLEEASGLVVSELQHFLETRPLEARRRYITVLKAVAANKASWSSIKRSLEEEEAKSISDSVLYNLLESLLKASILAKSDDHYVFTDPITAHAVTKL